MIAGTKAEQRTPFRNVSKLIATPLIPVVNLIKALQSQITRYKCVELNGALPTVPG